MCAREPVFAVYQRFGGSFEDGKRKTPKGSPIYTWKVYNVEAVKALRVLASGCLNKKRVCLAALDIAESMARNNRKQPLSAEEKVSRLRCLEVIVEGNKRGGSSRKISPEKIEKFLSPKDFGSTSVVFSDGRTFDSMSAAARELGVSAGAVWHGIRGGYAVKGVGIVKA
jgi:hypothetical protein